MIRKLAFATSALVVIVSLGIAAPASAKPGFGGGHFGGGHFGGGHFGHGFGGLGLIAGVAALGVGVAELAPACVIEPQVIDTDFGPIVRRVRVCD
jgi:hypothetical protein